ncbi:MAG: WbqC family protein [Flavobacteriaceae bacterium]|nr:WbqC family protein [Flavobacteriaceae bacterium]
MQITNQHINHLALFLQPTLFAPIIQYVALANTKHVVFEVEDNFQKQTYRNRYYVCGANGKQRLNVPIIHTKSLGKNRTKDIQIDQSVSWQKLHIKTLDAAYSSSPFYEFYKDDIISVIQKKNKYLLDLNFDSIAVINECLALDISIKKTKIYQIELEEENDLRGLAIAKGKQVYNLKKYTQVFNDKHGYISNLSILDLLFNEGTNALIYLEEHKPLFF